MSPRRIQQKRTKGWRKPEGAVSVARPSKRGNHYRVVAVGRGYAVKGPYAEDWGHYPTLRDARARAVQLYRVDVTDIDQGNLPLIQKELRGKDLMCFCPLDQPCHADVLLELANCDPRKPLVTDPARSVTRAGSPPRSPGRTVR